MNCSKKGKVGKNRVSPIKGKIYSYMRYLRLSSYLGRLFLLCGFAPEPSKISPYFKKISPSFFNSVEERKKGRLSQSKVDRAGKWEEGERMME